MKGLNMKKIVGVLITIAVIAALAYWGVKTIKAKSSDLNSNAFYAVFLNNGQVYFGHLADPGKQYVALTEIYYLQANKSLQQGDQSTADKDQAKLALVKLGKELHGPKDKMSINRDTILFYEELKEDSKVVDIIKKNGNLGETE